MRRGTALFAGLLLGLTAAAGAEQLYRIELGANSFLWAKERPVQNGPMLLFRRHPDGALVGLKSAQVRRIVAVSGPTASAAGSAGLKPGEQRVLGPTGGSPSSPASGVATAGAPAGGLRPGEGKGGAALFNPDRPYRPDWDSKLVPGATIPNPASPNDYVEGRTLAFPPATATQSAPGEPPMMPPPPELPK